MRRCVVITVRTLVVLALVVCLPLLALPPVSARVSDWMEDALRHKRLDFQFSEIGKKLHRAPDTQPIDKAEVQWQAPLVVSSNQNALAVEDAELSPRSSRKPSLPVDGQSTAKEPQPTADANPRILEIRERLIKRGAQYMRLDEISGQPSAYHFSCRMPVGGRTVYSRKFDSTDSDPVRAMTHVLDQVARWQAAHTSP